MSLSYVVLLTAFYVDNGPRLPLWNRLPVVAFWIGPSLIGLPLDEGGAAVRQAEAGRGAGREPTLLRVCL